MTTYNTGNPVPSTDPRDLLDNAQALDAVLNADGTTTTTRTGKTIKTMAGVQAVLDEIGLDTLENLQAALLADDAAYETIADIEAIVSPSDGDIAYTYAEPATNNPFFYRYDLATTSWVEVWDPQAATDNLQEQIDELSDNTPKISGGSVRFFDKNYQKNLELSGSLFQSKADLPQILGSGKSIILKVRLPLELMAKNRSYAAIGHDDQGGYFSIEYRAGHYFSIAQAYTFYVKVRQSGSFSALAFSTAAVSERDVFLSLHDSGSVITLDVYSCATGLKIATGNVSGTMNTGVVLYRDGFTIGDINGYDANGDLRAEPYSGFIGSISDVGILSDVLSDIEAAQCAMSDTELALVDIYGAGGAEVGYFRPLRSASNITDGVNFTSAAANLKVYGHINTGSTIGPATTEFYVPEKTTGFIAAIESPGSTSGRAEYAVATDGVTTDPIYFEVMRSNGEVIKSGLFVTPTAATTEYSAFVDIPVVNEWIYLRFYNSATSQYHNNRITAGAVICLTGQSQANILTSQYDAGFDKKDRIASVAFNQIKTGYDEIAGVEIIDRSCIRDGVNAFASHWFKLNNIPLMIIANAVAGTGVDQWLSDSDAAREWSRTEELISFCDGNVSAVLWMWVTNNVGAGSSYVTDILMPAIDGIPSSVAAPSGAPVVDHYIFDGLTFKGTPSIIVSPPTGHRSTSAGPFDYDNYSSNLGLARDAIVEWAESNGHAVGPYVNDMKVANNGVENTGGPHQDPYGFKGNPRVGIRLAEACCRWNGSSKLKNPTVYGFVFSDAGNTMIDMTVTMPNFGRLQTDGSATVTGVELSSDGGATWSRSGFTAVIHNSKTVRLTKTSGSWPGGLLARYQANGPFSYGTSVDELTTITGCLYDGSALDGSAIGDSLGTPVTGSTNQYAVVAF